MAADVTMNQPEDGERAPSATASQPTVSPVQSLALVLDDIDAGVFAVDQGWRILYVNRRAAEIFGRRGEELVGRELWTEFPQAWDSEFGHEYRRAVEERRVAEFEAYSPTLGRWFRVHAYPGQGSLTVWLHDVTERRAADIEGRERATRLREAFEHSMDAALVTIPDGRILLANPAAVELFGYSEDELRALGRAAVTDATDPRLAAFLEERRRTGRVRGEITAKNKQGRRFPVEISSAIFRDETGAEWTSMFIRDVSERRAREAERERLFAELDAQHRWLQAVLDHVPLAVLLVAPNGFVSANQRAEELLGTVEAPHRLLLPEGVASSPSALVSSHIESVASLGVELVVERRDGSRVPVLASIAPILDAKGRPIGAIGVFQDVSERMKAQEAVRANERLLNGIFDLLPVGVWIADRSGRIVRGNQAGLRIWEGARYVGPEQFGEYVAFWADTGKQIGADEWALARALEKGETSLGELIRIRCFDGTYKTIINSALPLYDEHREFAGAIVVNEDITKLKEVEEALRAALTARDEVLRVVAHDLRNPLHSLLLELQILASSGQPLLQVEQKTIAAMTRQAERINRLIEDLLDVARIEGAALRIERNPVPVDELLAHVQASQSPLVTKAHLELRLEPSHGGAVVSADHHRVMQVFENLVGNAIKFTEPGGRVVIGATRRDTDVLFWVRDTGPGVGPGELPHLFEPFWQAKQRERRGAGLGLPIAKGIIEAHGGRIWAESRPGVGTTIFFTIPLAG